MLEATIIFRKAGQKIPDIFLNKALEIHSAGIGYATASNKSIVLERGAGTFSAKDIHDICEAAKEHDVLFWLFEGKYLEDDLQPFVCMGTENEPKIVGMAEGKFMNFIPTASDHSNEYFLFNKYINVKIESLKLTDIDALFNNFGSDLFKMELTNSCGERGTIVLLGNSGRYIVFEKNDLKREYSWGWSSNHHGYTEEKVLTDAPAPRQTMKLGGKLKQITSMIGRPIASTEPIKPPPVEPPKADTATIVPVTTMPKMYTPPRSISNNALKHEYRKNLGYLPGNWKDRPTLPIPEGIVKPRIIKDFSELPKDLASDAATPIEKPKDDFVPVMTPLVIEAVKEKYEKNLDKNSQVIPDPEKILADQKKWPTFWEATGIEENITDAYDDRTLYNLCIDYPFAAFVLLKNYRANWLVSRITEGEAEYVEPDTSGTGVLKKEKEEGTPPVKTSGGIQVLKRKKVAM
jgi:hypothetical protein